MDERANATGDDGARTPWPRPLGFSVKLIALIFGLYLKSIASSPQQDLSGASNLHYLFRRPWVEKGLGLCGFASSVSQLQLLASRPTFDVVSNCFICCALQQRCLLWSARQVIKCTAIAIIGTIIRTNLYTCVSSPIQPIQPIHDVLLVALASFVYPSPNPSCSLFLTHNLSQLLAPSRRSYHIYQA